MLGEPAPGGLMIGKALVVEPAAVLAAWAPNATTVAVAKIEPDGGGWRLRGALTADVTVAGTRSDPALGGSWRHITFAQALDAARRSLEKQLADAKRQLALGGALVDMGVPAAYVNKAQVVLVLHQFSDAPGLQFETLGTDVMRLLDKGAQITCQFRSQRGAILRVQEGNSLWRRGCSRLLEMLVVDIEQRKVGAQLPIKEVRLEAQLE